MGKASQGNVAAEKEFFKLEVLLIQTADETAGCLNILKSNLSEYDRRHGLLFLNTSKSFLRRNIRFAKDAASELKHVADQITKSETLSEGAITVARSKVNAVFDAISELTKTAREYDRKNLNGVYGKGSDSNESESNWLGADKKSSNIEGSTQEPIADTVEAVVKSTVHKHFSGFTAVKHQLLVAEESLSPSFAVRVVDAMASMSESLKEVTNFEPEGKQSMSV